MSVAEEIIKKEQIAQPNSKNFINSILNFLSSVKFGVVLLCILVFLSLLGMLIIQQNVQGFETWFASLTPAEKTVYGFLGLFDIYHSWYYNILLLILSLNIVLASIDRFPGAWSFISRPKLDASRKWLLGQKQNATVKVKGANEQETAEKVSKVFKTLGLNPQITQKKGKFYIYGESGKWNRLGAYIVHVFLLTLFLGHFVALQTGFDADVRFVPGESKNQIEMIKFNLDKQERYKVELPFTIYCTDIQQKLVDPNGSIEVNNTLDWRTQIRIEDPTYGTTEADVSLNKPVSYRGYRFFQASAITLGSARTMELEVIPAGGGKPVLVELARGGTANLPDGTKIEYEGFFPDFVLNQGKPDTRSANYENPAVVLNVTPPNGERVSAFAFAANLPDSAPIGAPVAGYKWHLKSFEKSPYAHVLSIKYDPFDAAFIAWYIGGFGLIGALMFVFFLSHKRVWALVDEKDTDGFEVVLGGNTNRNHQGFEDKFNKLVQALDAEQNE
jgi:cytochrome c biogenesis protein